jgi:pyridoxal phosphate enzyme (YggS family)
MINYETIKNNWDLIKRLAKDAATKAGRDPDDVTIIAVSKTHAADLIMNALLAGITVFGENYAQEIKEKYEIISQQKTNQKPEWHFIGHLQTNKVKYIAPFISMIHSVDSSRLAQEISIQAEKNNRIIDVLLQVNTSGELSKSGCDPDEIFSLAEQVLKFKNINIRGLMTIGSFSDDIRIVRSEFVLLRELMKQVRGRFPENKWEHLSMGMSGDYELAIAEGATMVRVGSAIFGSRYYG